MDIRCRIAVWLSSQFAWALWLHESLYRVDPKNAPNGERGYFYCVRRNCPATHYWLPT